MKRLLHAMQTTTGATKGEVIVVLLLLIGAVLGNVLQRLDSGSGSNKTMSPAQIREILDASTDDRQPLENAIQEPATHTGPTAARPRTVSTPERQSTIVNLNTASKTRLMSIPGVGEATADRILQYRSHSPFTRPEDLQNIKGIGEKRFERMRPFITAP
jgi:competence protein ComEA